MYLRLLQKLIARDEREKHHVAALYRRDTRRTQWVGWLVGGTLALLLMQVISRPQELLIFLCGAAFLLAHPFRSLGRNEEEFAFTLPLPRRLYWQYDLATLVLPLAALSLFGTVVVSLELAAKFWGLFLDGPWVQTRELWSFYRDKTAMLHSYDIPRLNLLPVIFTPMLLGACLSLQSWFFKSTILRLGAWLFLALEMTRFKMSLFHGITPESTALLELDLNAFCLPNLGFDWSFPWILLIAFPLLWWLVDWFVDEREVEAAMGEESLSAPRLPLPQWSRLGLGSGRVFIGLIVIVASLLLLKQFHQDTHNIWQERFPARAKLNQGDQILREPTPHRLLYRPSMPTHGENKVLLQVVMRDDLSGKIILANEKVMGGYPGELAQFHLYDLGRQNITLNLESLDWANLFRAAVNLHSKSVNDVGSYRKWKIDTWCRMPDDFLDPRFCHSALRLTQGQSLWMRSLVFDKDGSFTSIAAIDSLLRAERQEAKSEKSVWCRQDYGVGEMPLDQRSLLPAWEGNRQQEFWPTFRLSIGEVLLLSLLLGFGLLLGPRRLLWSLPLGGFLIVVGLALFEAKIGAQWKKEGIPVMDHFLASPAKDGGVR